ncbi:transposase [Sphingomonas sp.]|uniref:transposase n=1 Tax=Sphingomonas sp. TaxID=28214 RepID=UPI00344F5FC4
MAGCRAVDVLLDDPAPRTIVLADKAYDSNAIRDLRAAGSFPNIPSKASARKRCFSKTLYKGRNAVERVFRRLKRVSRHHYPLRQARHQLPQRHPLRCSGHMVVMRPGPRLTRLS